MARRTNPTAHRAPRPASRTNKLTRIAIPAPATELTPAVKAMVSQFAQEPPRTLAQLISYSEQMAQAAREALYRPADQQYKPHELFKLKLEACELLKQHILCLNNGVSTEYFYVTFITTCGSQILIFGLRLFNRNRVGQQAISRETIQLHMEDITCNIEPLRGNKKCGIKDVFPDMHLSNYTIDTISPDKVAKDIRNMSINIATDIAKYLPMEK
jgi:hypothetical protein